MKRLIYIPLFLILFFGCTSHDMDSMSLAPVNIIAGTWRLTGEEQGIIGQSNWATVAADSSYDVVFRNDGVIMTSAGLPACCSPSSLTINGSFFEIKPSTQLAPNPACYSVNCTNCLIWDLAVSGNEMIISRCKGTRQKYTRI